MTMPSRLYVYSVALLAAFSSFGCEATRDADLPQKTPPRKLDRVQQLKPTPEPEIAKAWARLRLAPRNQRAPIRSEIAQMYETRGYKAMSALLSTANEVTDGQAQPAVRDILERRDPRWACPSPSPDVATELDEMDRYVTSANYTAARDAGLRAMGQKGPVCSLMLETAIATLALASTSQPVSADEFELALRTFLTADVEMNLRPQQGGRPWPYGLAARALINYDPPTALIVAEAARTVCISEKCSEMALRNADTTATYIRGLFR